jgi:TetR/AcrR family transcriptional regulator
MDRDADRQPHREPAPASQGPDGTARPHGKAAIRSENERLILAAAESVFADYGFDGATTRLIAERAGLPKANLHYYFPTKEDLYRRVVDGIFQVWLQAAASFDDSDDPADALTRYIHAKMDLSRSHPLGSKVWASEVMHRAPLIQDYLETRLTEWTASRAAIIDRWIAAGRMRPVDPYVLLYLIWATTQHYADFGHQIKTLNGGRDLSDVQFAKAKAEVTAIILRGVGLES